VRSEADQSDLQRRASNGDAAAQYALAAIFARSGRRDDAERWLTAAAEAGHADALYTIATRKLRSLAGAAEAVDQLKVAADGGSEAAARLIAALRAMGVGVPRDDCGATAALVDLARSGSLSARREIACLLALSDQDHPAIAGLLEAERPSDPVGAAFALARAAAGRPAGGRRSLDAAAALLARVRYPRAGSLARNGAAPDETPLEPLDWRAVISALTLSPRTAASAAVLSNAPRIRLFRNAVAPEVCEYVIAHAASRLAPSLVYDPRGGGAMRHPERTSATAVLSSIDLDVALVALNRLIAAAADESDAHGEFLSILHYAPGQQYRPHFDCIPQGEDFERNGQRIKTALLFLNDEYEGGETHFLSPDLKVRGRRGDLLVFSNVDAEGRPDLQSRHAGLPVSLGEKWIASKWFRDKNFSF
jgi:hypothetical protein